MCVSLYQCVKSIHVYAYIQFACAHTCAMIWVSTCISVDARTYLFVCIFVHVCNHVSMCAHACAIMYYLCNACTYIFTHACVCVCRSACAHVYACVPYERLSLYVHVMSLYVYVMCVHVCLHE